MGAGDQQTNNSHGGEQQSRQTPDQGPRMRAVLFTDLVDSVGLKSRNGHEEYLRIREIHDRIIDEAVKGAGGRVENDTGDGYLIIFDTPCDAVRAALRIQADVAAAHWDRECVGVRIGVHCGVLDVQPSPGGAVRLVGLSIDVCARVVGLARGGQILLTQKAYDDAKVFLDEAIPDGIDHGAAGSARVIRWMCHGQFRLRGVDSEVEIWEVGYEDLAPMKAPEVASIMSSRVPQRRSSGRLIHAIGLLGVGLVAVGASAAFFDLRPVFGPHREMALEAYQYRTQAKNDGESGSNGFEFARELAKQLVDVSRQQGRLEERIVQLESEKAALQEQVAAGVARVEERADEGDVQAKAAISEARKSGDATKLKEALLAEAARQRKAIQELGSQFVDLQREIAAMSYLTGDLKQAEQSLHAILRLMPDDPGANNLLGHVFFLRGELAHAESHHLRVLDSALDERWRAITLSHLGRIHRTRGELDRAEEFYRESLVIAGAFGWEEAMGTALSEIGLCYQVRGKLGQAEELHRKSLEIAEKLRLLEGMACDYGNLGQIYHTRGEFGKAEEYYRRSLAINITLGWAEGTAIQYGNLAMIHETRGALIEAEECYLMALEINEQFGFQEGMARDFGNLGVIYRMRGNLDKAELYAHTALEINEKLGRSAGAAIQYGNLGLIYEMRGELERAEEYLCKALMIEEKLGQREGLADVYINLGLVYEARKNCETAEVCFREALSISERLPWPEGVAKANWNLGVIAAQCGKIDEAMRVLMKARDLYQQIGMPHLVEAVQGWIERLEGRAGPESR